MANNRMAGRGIINLGAGTMQGFEATDRTQERRSFVVSNLAAVADGYEIYVVDTAKLEVMAVFPKDRQAFDTAGMFYVKNPNAVAVNIIVGEVFLTGGAQSAGQGPGGGGGGGGGGDTSSSYQGGTRRSQLP